MKFIIDNNLSSSNFKIDTSNEEIIEKNKPNKTSERSKYKNRSTSKKELEKVDDDIHENNSIVSLINEKKSGKSKKNKVKIEKKDVVNDIEISSDVNPDRMSKKHTKTKLKNSGIDKEKKPRKSDTRKKQASVKIDVVNINESKKKTKPKKKGWWNN